MTIIGWQLTQYEQWQSTAHTVPVAIQSSLGSSYANMNYDLQRWWCRLNCKWLECSQYYKFTLVGELFYSYLMFASVLRCDRLRSNSQSSHFHRPSCISSWDTPVFGISVRQKSHLGKQACICFVKTACSVKILL